MESPQERPCEKQMCTARCSLETPAQWALMALLLLILLVGFVVLGVCIFRSYGPSMHLLPTDFCDSPACLDLLETYLVSGNISVPPCSDFYSFACGKAKGTSNSLQALAEKNKDRLRSILEAPSPWPPGSEEEKVFQFYSSCMDTDAIEAAGAGPLRQVIKELGGWEPSGNWTSFDFNRTLRLLMSQYGYFPFFKAYLRPHPTLLHTPVIQIDQPELAVPLKQEQEQKIYAQIVREYLAYLNQLGTLLGGAPDKLQDHTSWSIHITSRLSQFLRPPEERQAQNVTIAQLQDMVPVIDWLSCLQATFAPMPLSPSQPLVVQDLGYLKDMSQLVGGPPLRQSEFLQSHMILGLVDTLSPALHSSFQKARQELSQKLRALTRLPPLTPSPRWMKCVEETGTFFEPTLAALFVREAFSWHTQRAAMELFSAIKGALVDRLQGLPWMNKEAGQEAQERVNRLQVEMGTPGWALEPELTTQGYPEVQLDPSFLQLFLSCVRALRARTVRSFLQPFPHHSWHVSPWGVNSYYSLPDHVVVFPAGLLQAPFFHPDYPRAVNFGAAGSLMAQQLLRIFDQLLLPGGCPACDAHALQEALLCLKHHYDALSLSGETSFNNSSTLLETAADTGGLAIALQAYNKTLLLRPKDTTLPHLGLSPQQLFFLSYAQAMCGESQLQDPQDPGIPPPLRILGPVTNTWAFTNPFHCPQEALMSPSSHCHVW